MEKQNDKEIFNYVYSAEQQEEIQQIRNKYVKREEDKMELLRRLDRGVTHKGTVASLVIGILGTLIMGIGMCCTMVWAESLFVPGVIVGVIGIALLSAAYPLYSRITKKERERIAPEILRLTDELIK